MPIRISNPYFHLKIPKYPGIYKIISLDENDIPIPLQRVLGIDYEGILYIGKSENLNDRLRMLWRVLQPKYKASSHTFGENYNSLKLIRDVFPFNSLAIVFEKNKQAKSYEKELIENYRQTYGEVPPLNSSK